MNRFQANTEIAIFMGASIDSGIARFEGKPTPIKSGHFVSVSIIEMEISRLDYHTSWNSLMPVIKALREHEGEPGIFGIMDSERSSATINHWLCKGNIEKTFEAVAEFAKRLNKLKND